MKWCVLGFLVLNSSGLLNAASTAIAAPKAPEVLSVFPFGGQKGTSLEVEILGTDLHGASTVMFGDDELKGTIVRIEPAQSKSLPGTEPNLQTIDGKKPAHLERILARFEIPRNAKTGAHSLRIVSPRGVSNALRFHIDSEPLIVETGKPHASPSQAQPVKFPCVISGKIGKQGEIDYYAFDISKDQRLSFKIDSNRFGKEDRRDLAELALYEPGGSWFDPRRATRLAFSDNTFLTYAFSRPGRYLLEVGSFLGVGGIDLVYQLEITQTEALPMTADAQSKPGLAGWEERSWERPLDPNRLRMLSLRTNTGAAPWEEVSRQSSSHKVGASESNFGGGPISSFRSVSIVKETNTTPNGAAARPGELKLPTLVEGIIAHPGEVDTYKFHAEAGERLVFEIQTPDAKPPQFNPRLGLFDNSGSELCSNIFRYAGGASADYIKTLEPKTTFNFDRQGDYTLQIRDITSRDGGPNFFYRLLIRPQFPHLGKVELSADRINLVAGQAAELNLISELEEGFAGQVAFRLDNLPVGVQAVPGTEVEPERVPLPDEGRKELYRPKSERAIIMLVANAHTPVTRMPHMVRVVANPVTNGIVGAPVQAGEFLLMVIAPDQQGRSRLPAQRIQAR